MLSVEPQTFWVDTCLVVFFTCLSGAVVNEQCIASCFGFNRIRIDQLIEEIICSGMYKILGG